MSRVRLYAVTEALLDRIADLADERQIKGFRALSHRTGGEVSHQTVWRILTGQSRHVRYATLAAFAEALDVPVDDFIALSLDGGGDTPWQLGTEFDKVPGDMRPAIERTLLALFRELRILPRADRI